MGAFPSERVLRHAPRFWLPLSHAEAMTLHPQLALRALCDVDAAALARAGEHYGITRLYQDYRRLIDEVAPDVLGIATRTPERPRIMEYAVMRGVRALHAEKPLCNSVKELLALEKLLGSPSVACTYGALRRYLPVYGQARQLVQSGRYGELQQVQVCFGPAPLFWTHAHSMDVLLFMAGDATVGRVSAR